MPDAPNTSLGGSADLLGMRSQQVQSLRKLLRRRRERVAQGRFGIEGPGLVLEALASDLTVEQVFVGVDQVDSEVVAVARGHGVSVLVVDDRAITAIGSTATPQPVYAVALLPQHDLSTRLSGSVDPVVLVLADVSDPGNAGTLLRAGEVAGVDLFIAAGDTVDLFGPKCVRSSAGSIFRMPTVVERDTEAVLRELQSVGVRSYSAALDATTAFTAVDLTGPVALIVGNEAHGTALAPELLAGEIQIPMSGRTESLNVAMAGTLVVYEVFRQRNQSLLPPPTNSTP
ncbi:MAG: RNA methyltransferase [Acidimicrobiales bacterium]